jgi:NADH-quinone oxidoreductase subunit A
VACLFLLVALLLGRLLRASNNTPQKMEPYECGEPSVGSGFVQFDLRFYVVALVFIIFEVEVALFFPAATIFGKATQCMRYEVSAPGSTAEQPTVTTPGADLGLSATSPPAEATADARTLALAAMADLGVFFAVILVAFAYVWWQGDLNWVRAIGQHGLGVQERGRTVPKAVLRIAE